MVYACTATRRWNHWRRGRITDELGGQANREDQDDQPDEEARLFCTQCHTPFHRDVMAASNMVNAVKEYLWRYKRPRYLQPMDNGNHLWENGDGDSQPPTVHNSYTLLLYSAHRNRQRTKLTSFPPFTTIIFFTGLTCPFSSFNHLSARSCL